MKYNCNICNRNFETYIILSKKYYNTLFKNIYSNKHTSEINFVTNSIIWKT